MNAITSHRENVPLTIVTRPIHPLKRLWASSVFRRAVVIILLAALWQAYALWVNNKLLFPTLTDTFIALFNEIVSGEIPQRVYTSLGVLLTAYFIGIAIAGLLVGIAATSRLGTTFLETLTATLMPLPAIVLLPLAMLWFGLGVGSLIFVLLHSVVWVVAMNTHAGFRAVSQTLRMVGRNYGLGFIGFVFKILVPAAFPSILAGLKVGWAFAWRTLVAAELVFGATSGRGGLGWYIYVNKNELEITNVFAGLLMVIFIGLVIDGFVFRLIEKHTVKKWGMQIDS